VKLPSRSHLLIGGSTHESEEEELLRCYERLLLRRSDVALLLAPRHLERLDRVEQMVRAQGFPCVRWSRLNGEISKSVILLDTMGELSTLYGLAESVFVGGSWVSRGGHNVMEPAAWGKPLFFGPHMENYSSAAATLVRLGAAREVRDGVELAEVLGDLVGRPDQLSEMGRSAKSFVLENQGAVERNLEVIEAVLTAKGILKCGKAKASAVLHHSLPAGAP
jgi:3-deoxy-D-manno-octulosonic-acid transferase